MRKKKERFVGVSIALLSVVAACSLARAEDPKSWTMPRLPFELRKRGTVRVIRDESGKVTAIKLDVTVFEITLDEGSKPLEAMDGQKVKVIGTYKREGDKRWLTVKSVEPVSTGKKEPAGPKAEKARPADKAGEKPEKKAIKGPEKKADGKPVEKTAEEPAEKPAK